MKTLIVVVAVLFAQVGCDKGSKTSKTSTNESSTLPTVKVLDAGTGPKQALRFTAQKGLKKTLTMTMDMAMTINAGGSPRTQTIPPIAMAMDISVVDVAANGDFRYEFKLRRPEVMSQDPNDPAAQAMKQGLAGLEGLSGSALVTNRGFTKEVDIKVPAGANAQVAQFVDTLKQSISQMSAPLPDQPVGVGAKWEITTKLEQSSISMQQVALNELVSLEGNAITFNISLKQTAPPQKITKNGTTVQLKTYAGSGTGQTNLDLTQIVPTSGKLTMKSEMQMEAGGQAMGMSLDLGMTVAAQ